MSTIKSDNIKRFSGEKIEANDRYGREYYQPLSKDWVEMADDATGAASGVLTFSDSEFDATATFQKGDRVRLKQGGSYKYFNVIAVTTSTITLYAGDDYSLTATSVTNLGFSRLVSPSGFPFVFQYTPTLTATGSMTVTKNVSTGIVDVYFFIIGNVVFLYGTLFDLDLGGSPSFGILVTLPVNTAAGYTSSQFSSLGVNNNSEELIKYDFGTTGNLGFSRVDTVNWTTGSAVCDLFPNCYYFI